MAWWLAFQLPVQPVPTTTNVVSTNPAHDEVYSIQRYVIKFVSDLVQVGDFFPVSSTNKLTPRYIWNIVVIGVKHRQTNI